MTENIKGKSTESLEQMVQCLPPSSELDEILSELEKRYEAIYLLSAQKAEVTLPNAQMDAAKGSLNTMSDTINEWIGKIDIWRARKKT